MLDNRGLISTNRPMTVLEHPNLPQGYVQLTEGRIRTTDLVFGKNSSTWGEPHAFVVGSAVGEDDTKVARRVAPESKSNRVRS
jgi:hypothetical protein